MTGPVVEIASGRLCGETRDGVHAFLGIPYGRAARFRPAQAPEPWPGVREAIAYGPTAPQPPAPPARLDRDESPPQSEDCLVLNVWTASPEGARPVLVWLHGGGFSTGSGSLPWYDGSALARRGDVVVVTVNHRLGLLGFLDLGSVSGELADAGQAGMLDLVAALEWVRDSIAAFGGDPRRVTIFGESGGGGKVSALLAMPPAAGLFHRAAIQSGVFLDGPGELGQPRERAAAIAERVVAEAGGVDALLAAPPERLLGLQRAAESVHRPGSGGVMPFCPIVDGRVLPAHPREALAAGASADVPLVVGSNLHETTLFLWLADASFREHPLAWDLDDDALLARLGGYAGDRAPRLVERYRELMPGARNRDLYVAISSDNMRMGGIRVAEAKLAGGGAPVFSYLFAWESPVAGGALGAAHGFEIPFVFDTVERRAATRAAAGHPLVRRMSSAWASFAADGVPADWPEYGVGRRATLVFADEVEVVDDPGAEARRAWLGDNL